MFLDCRAGVQDFFDKIGPISHSDGPALEHAGRRCGLSRVMTHHMGHARGHGSISAGRPFVVGTPENACTPPVCIYTGVQDVT